jgi:gliding motility associated protien GldN
MLRRYLGIVLLTAFSTSAFAQAEVEESSEVNEAFRSEMEEQYNPNSLMPIPVYEHHYRVRVWRSMDLQEKQNKGYFAKNGELSKLVMDAVASGEITDIYANDSLTTKISKEEFVTRLQQEEAVQQTPWLPTDDKYTDDLISYNGKNYRALRDSRGANPETSPDDWAVTSEGKATFFFASDVSNVQIVEDIIFDKRRSRLYYDMQGFELSVPGAKTRTGFNQSLGWFKYKDLEKLFRAHPKKAVWFNRQNTAQNKNFADAFLLRLFHGSINKIENPEDETIFSQYLGNGRPYREAVWATEWAEVMLMEKEHNLWEF